MSAKRSIYNKDKANAVFAVKIRKLFEESGKTHNNLAEYIEQRLGESVTRQAVGQWCNGNTCPNLRTVPIIAEFFGVSTDYLLTDTEIKTTNAELKAVCEYTGLSESAVSKIKDSIDTYHIEELHGWVSLMLQSDRFWNIAYSIMEYDLYSQLQEYLSHIENALAEIIDSDSCIEYKSTFVKSVADLFMLNCQHIYADEEYRRKHINHPMTMLAYNRLIPETYYIESVPHSFLPQIAEHLEMCEYRATKELIALASEDCKTEKLDWDDINTKIIERLINERLPKEFTDFVSEKLQVATQKAGD